MNPKLQEAYDALKQADAAGNVEDAQQIADYIRELQNQEMLGSGDESMMRNPVAAGAVGAIAGPVAGKVLETAYGPKGVSTGAPTTAPGAGSPGQKWAAKTGYGAGTGATVENVVEEFKKREGPLGKGKVTSKITGGPLGGPAAMESIAAKEADAARFAQMRAANQMAAQKASSVPGRIAQATAGKMPLLLKSAAGAGAGVQGADAYNRLQQDDFLGAGIGAIGAAGSAASLIPHPVTRIGGTAIGMGAGALNAYIDYLKSKSQPQPMAMGGLVNMARGKAVTETKKAATEAAKKLSAKMSPGLSFGNMAPVNAQTVTNPLRNEFPGIYKRPDVIAQEAAARVAPEDPMLKRLFGVTRDDLFEMSQRQGNVPGFIPGASKNPKGSAAAEAVMNPRNTQRLIDVLGEVKTNAPELYKGMHAWYTMDPQYHRMVELMGEEKAKQMYHRLNTFGGIESPNLPVPVEFNRASAANWLAEQGRMPDWIKYGGLRDKPLIEGIPADMIGIPGRVGHQRASESQRKFMETGEHGMISPKAPPYIQASSVPELGFQTDLPVGDAHWSRMIGLPDVRTSKEVSASVSTPELQQLAPWWKKDVAGAMDLESVPAQAIMWGAGSPQTGVKTAIGAGKLELQAIQMAEAAKRLGISPENARDLILMGKERAGKKEGGPVQYFDGGGKAGVLPKVAKYSISQYKKIAEALEEYLKGNITKQQQMAVTRQYLPIRQWNELPPEYTDEQIINALSSNQLGKALAPVPVGKETGNRLDINAYTKNNPPVFVDTVHDINDKNKVISYNRTGHLRDVDFKSLPNSAVLMGLGTKEQALTPMGAQMGKSKAPIAMIRGTNVGTSDAEVRRMMAEMLNDPNYTQIGMDPRVGSQFYDKATDRPIWTSGEKFQIGPLVMVPKKDIEVTDWLDPRLELKDFPSKRFKEGGSTTPAWQRSEGKSPSGGLNALGRASYKRETGGELKAPQPEGGSRKKSFCARMGGMKKKLTSSKTANDPDSRINKALRKWKC